MPKLVAAMICYAVLAILAAATLDGGKMRDFIWIFLAALAFKTYIAHRREGL